MMSKITLSMLLGLSTIGVLTLCLTPTPQDSVYASFDKSLDANEMISRVASMDLSILSSDEELRHVIVSNEKGDAPLRLKRAGANFIINAKFAQFCASAAPSKRKTNL